MSQSDDVPEQETLRRLWREEASGRRGPKPSLNLDAIVDRAMALADEEGLERLSMARLASALGYSPMALYRHVSGKEELLVLMADAMAGQLPRPEIDAASTWREALEAWTRAQIDGLAARPWILELPLSAALPGPQRLAWMDAAMEVMAPLPIGTDEKIAILGLLSTHALGEARVLSDSRRMAARIVRAEAGISEDVPADQLDPEAMTAADPYADYTATLGRLADPERFPALHAALASDDRAGPGTDDAGDDLGFGLGVVLDGIEAYVARRS